jgi:hypothetical protein
MNNWFDATLYPDVDPPTELTTLADQVDFLARLCAAWDFGVTPYIETIREIRRPEWKEAVDACQLLTSHTYQLLRRWHDLSASPYLGQKLAYIRDDPNLTYI